MNSFDFARRAYLADRAFTFRPSAAFALRSYYGTRVGVIVTSDYDGAQARIPRAYVVRRAGYYVIVLLSRMT